jgi:cell division protease FtsH
MDNWKKNMSSPQWHRILLFALLSFLVLSIFLPYAPVRRLEIPYSRFKQLVQKEKVSEVTFQGERIKGRFDTALTEELGVPEDDEALRVYESFETIQPSVEDRALLPLLEHKGVAIHAEPERENWWRVIFIGFLPWLLIIGLILYSVRRFQGGMGGRGGLFGFGKSKAKLYTKETSTVGYDDVAGLVNTKKELQEVVDFLKDPSRFQALGGELPRGILLVGPPGTGKTLMARATAGEAGVPFYSISGSEFIEMFVGVGASRVRDMFEKAKKDAPAIIFIDELDSIGRVRGTGVGGGHDEREQTLNQILSEMDGFSPHHSVVVLSATNRPDVLDPALTRPGRFDRQVTLDLPQKKARKDILEVHTRNVPVGEDVHLDLLARKTVGFSGADLKNLVNEAALLAARKQKKVVEREDFDEGRDKILMGIEREDAMKDEEKETIAYHEAGHALMARLTPGTDPLEKVSIIPRGRSLGATEQIPEEDRRNLTRTYLLNRIAIMLGGRVAEKLAKNDLSSGAGDDLKKATELARRMVCQWGMSEKLGPVTFSQGEPHPFLGREIAQPKDFSERTAQIIDEEIRSMVREREKKAEEILSARREELDLLARELMERETLSKEEIEELLDLPPEEEESEEHGEKSKE